MVEYVEFPPRASRLQYTSSPLYMLTVPSQPMLRAWRKDSGKKFGGGGNKARHVTIGQVTAEIKSCRRLVPTTVRLKHHKTSNSTLAAAH